MRKSILALFLLTAPVVADEVTLQTADLDGVLKAVAKEKGKVVVIDVWGNF